MDNEEIDKKTYLISEYELKELLRDSFMQRALHYFYRHEVPNLQLATQFYRDHLGCKNMDEYIKYNINNYRQLIQIYDDTYVIQSPFN
jgi:hypothetical protein